MMKMSNSVQIDDFKDEGFRYTPETLTEAMLQDHTSYLEIITDTVIRVGYYNKPNEFNYAEELANWLETVTTYTDKQKLTMLYFFCVAKGASEVEKFVAWSFGDNTGNKPSFLPTT
jgi:hypothetical protein